MESAGRAASTGFILHTLGLSQGAFRRVTFSNVVLATLAAGTTGWALWLTHTADHRIERYVVVLDDQNQLVLTARAGHENWMPTNGFLVKFAQDWVRNMRSRPNDPETIKHQWREVVRTTDQRLWGVLQEAAKDADTQLRAKTVSVLSISANVVARQGTNITMLVNWTERVDGSVDKDPKNYTATLGLSVQQPLTQGDAKREFERNPTGVYVTSFQPTLMEHND